MSLPEKLPANYLTLDKSGRSIDACLALELNTIKITTETEGATQIVLIETAPPKKRDDIVIVTKSCSDGSMPTFATPPSDSPHTKRKIPEPYSQQTRR